MTLVRDGAGGVGGGFSLGPEKNIFDVGSGSLADAQLSLNSYTSSHSGWLTNYDGDKNLCVILL